MANWAFTEYAIEGTKDNLQKIEQAILHHDVKEGSSEDWEGNVLLALGCKWEERTPDGKGKYLRGFINEEPWWEGENVLRFCAEEAWGATDFHEVLREYFPDINIFYSVEESNEGIYATNDKEGKYFPYRFYVDTCIDGNYAQEYFRTIDKVYEWLGKLTNGEVKSQEDVDKFTACHEDSATEDENFIFIHEFKIVD